MSHFLVFRVFCLLGVWISVRGNIYENGELVVQNVLRWNYTYMNPTCTDSTGDRNPCQDVRICTHAAASLALGGWPTLCGWVGKGVPKVCCGLPLVVGPGLMKKMEEEMSRSRECGLGVFSRGLSETRNKFFQILKTLPPVDISNPEKFDPPLDLHEDPIIVQPMDSGSRQGRFPWMVSIRMNGSHVCGGSLIDSKHILTAAHCVTGNKDQYAVHVGNLYFDDGYAFYISKIAVHPKYQIGNSNDLAILTLREEILTPYVPHICLPGTSDENLEGQGATLLRWGNMTLNGTNRQILRIIEGLSIVPIEECKRSYVNEVIPEETGDLICTKTNQSDEEFCEDDYGGPLMYRDDQNPNRIIIGVDTFGSMCGNTKPFRLYTRVSRHLNWILLTTNE